MKKKSTNYSSGDAGGWMHVSDDAFLAQFRGRPCAICGETSGEFNNRKIRSMGHHLASKELHRLYRYDPRNIIVLCPAHHLGGDMSPHSHDVCAQAAFYEWLRINRPEQYRFMIDCRHDKFDKSWTYRDVYQLLGGQIKGALKKDMRPHNHAALIRKIEAE